MTLREFTVVQFLYEHEHNTLINSVSVLQLCEYNREIQDKNRRLSESTARRSLIKLINLGFVAESLKIGKQKTYYLTQKGINFVEYLLQNN